jgi:hypothetical protein
MKRVNKCHNVRFTYISVHTVHDNADRVSGTKVFVCVARLSQSCWNELYQNCGYESLILSLH